MPAFETASTLAPQIGASAAIGLSILATRRVAALRPAGAAAVAASRSARMRSLCTLALVVGLGLVWISELQSLLLSFTAVAMATVLATKELIQCATGTLARRLGNSFQVGDQIHLDGTSGRVVATNALTTTIAETEARTFGSRPTGRRLVIPNSRIFSGGIHVEDRAAPLRYHTFQITLEAQVGLRDLLAFAAERAEAHAEAEAGGARVALSTSELGKPRLDVALFVRASEAFEAERAIALAVLERAAGEGTERTSRAPLALVRDLAA